MFIAEAYFQLQDYGSSNEQLYKVLESNNNNEGAAAAVGGDDIGELTSEMLLKTYKMIARNFLHS